MPDVPDLESLLSAWGIDAAAVTPAVGDAAPTSGEAWRVETAEGHALLLRRADPGRSTAQIAFEHLVLAFLSGRDWPVLAPLACREGGTLVEAQGARWDLLPLPTGAAPPDESIFLQRRGALLALLHEDLAEWQAAGAPRARLDDFDAGVQVHGLASFEALLARVQRVDVRRANVLALLRARVEEQLEASGYADFPVIPIWGACSAAHVLFDGNDVMALTGFEGARLDARAVDIAASILADTRSIGWRIIRWVAGYAAHAQPPLTTAEADLIPVAMAALALDRAARALAEAHAGAGIDEAALRQVDEAMTVEANEGDLREVIRTAARLEPASRRSSA